MENQSLSFLPTVGGITVATIKPDGGLGVTLETGCNCVSDYMVTTAIERARVMQKELIILKTAIANSESEALAGLSVEDDILHRLNLVNEYIRQMEIAEQNYKTARALREAEEKIDILEQQLEGIPQQIETAARNERLNNLARLYGAVQSTTAKAAKATLEGYYNAQRDIAGSDFTDTEIMGRWVQIVGTSAASTTASASAPSSPPADTPSQLLATYVPPAPVAIDPASNTPTDDPTLPPGGTDTSVASTDNDFVVPITQAGTPDERVVVG